MSDRTTDSEMVLKRGHFLIAVITVCAMLAVNGLIIAYNAGQMSEKLNNIAIALVKIDNIPARVLVLEQSDRDYDRRLVEVERRVLETERRQNLRVP